jgi:hypothetical protein
VREPGLDRHEWETEWEGLEAELEDAPAQALPEVGDFIERMLRDRGLPLEHEDADDGIAPEILADYRSARETALRVERGDDVDPSDIGEAIHNFRDLYDQLIERPEL